MSIRKLAFITAIVFHVGVILSAVNQPDTYVQCSYNNTGICSVK